MDSGRTCLQLLGWGVRPFSPDHYGDGCIWWRHQGLQIFVGGSQGGCKKFFQRKNVITLKSNCTKSTFASICNVKIHEPWISRASLELRPRQFVKCTHNPLCQAQFYLCFHLTTRTKLKLPHSFLDSGRTCLQLPPTSFRHDEGPTIVGYWRQLSWNPVCPKDWSSLLMGHLQCYSSTALLQTTSTSNVVFHFQTLIRESCWWLRPEAFPEINESLTALLSMKLTTCLAAMRSFHNSMAMATARNSHSWMMVCFTLGFKRLRSSPCNTNLCMSRLGQQEHHRTLQLE